MEQGGVARPFLRADHLESGIGDRLFPGGDLLLGQMADLFFGDVEEVAEGDVLGFFHGPGECGIGVGQFLLLFQQTEDPRIPDADVLHLAGEFGYGLEAGVRIRFGEDNIESDRLGPISLQGVYESCDGRPRPGPPAQFAQALLVDRHDDRLAACRHRPPVDHPEVKGLQLHETEKRGVDKEQDEGDEDDEHRYLQG